MKKFALILLVAVLCVPIFAFAACADPSDDPYDLSTKEIGYEIPVYPDCEFSYVVKWEEWDPETREPIEKSCMVKVTDFSAILINKSPVSEGDILDEDYGYYTIKLHMDGLADTILVGETLWFQTKDAQGSSIVNIDGSITWDFEYSFTGYEHSNGQNKKSNMD